ncbi:hypothetical protein IAQ61_009605 [Plenodomus lingam]|uniref:C2H2-type domain-containing protein n=1 Tax=Leptosphaeria maculans (strain JN3 / isolate v23.1.3 / race Av1-4-5-6-7-8) TaxID=985895 RepID=E4ZSW9_LEPMJ|nr:hypothetical protein LEMA_P120480.1 [Plenodomus lingam JN3]KAH9863328.1 hypothetical protein IAQ61_009605 [Plenodomus lingam]CBX94557.1 hypothetical protein LEMA_P120480.1 [Plenodomus lingam JN3]
MNDYYDDSDARLGSPPLEAVVVRTTPSPSPTPVVIQPYRPLSLDTNFNSSSCAPSKSRNRARTRPTQGDWVLIREMDPNRPDIAQQVSERALESGSASESDEDDDADMEESYPAAVHARSEYQAPPRPQDLQAQNVQRFAAISFEPHDPKATASHRDSVIDDDVLRAGGPLADRRPSYASNVSSTLHGGRSSVSSASMTPHGHSILPLLSSTPHSQQNGVIPNGQSHGISSTASPHLRPLAIPSMGGQDKLPALQAPSPAHDAGSPCSQQSLPSFRHIDDIARSATSEQDMSRPNGFHHRQSVSSVGQSPTSMVRQLSISSHSPGTPFSLLSASSPMSANGDSQRADIFLRAGGAGVFGTDARRPSHAASEGGGAYHSTHHSGSTSESYQSTDGLSPGSQPTPIEPRARHVSLDDALASRVLPPPLGSGMQAIPSHSTGSFKCDYPHCNAQPFQTQYLLNSHTNVHSQNRPHYCPVKGCPRGEGGKGFKRKNEMIRHGLVHQSPGYVCPFCPDREHKYPRPDNLQRHVRVHHIDKDKDDAQLRDVLAQRPEGGSRGRRRRVSETGRS